MSPVSGQEPGLRERIAEALEASIAAWWQTPPRLDLAADAVLAEVQAELATKDARIAELEAEVADKHDELRVEIECNAPSLRDYALMNADLQDNGFAPGEPGLMNALGTLKQAEAERDRLRTWPGLMETLAALYPPDVIDGSSGDPGPQIVTLAREVDRLRAAVEQVRKAFDLWTALRHRDGDDLAELIDEIRAALDQAPAEEASGT